MKGFSSAASQLIMAVVAAAIGIGLFWYSDYSNKNYFTDNLEINRHLQSLQTDFYAIESEILRCGSFLYYNYDVLRKLIRSSRSHLQELRRSGNLHAQIHSDSYLGFLSLDAKFKEFQNTLENYLTLNASLKNSVVYIPNLQLRSYHIFDPSVPRERDTLMLLSKIGNTILLTKNTFDSDFLKNLNRYTDELAKETNKEKRVKSYINLAINGIKTRNYPQAYENLFKAEKLEPDNKEVQNLLGLTYMYDDKTDKAIASFKKALEIDPKYSEAHNHIGIIYSENGNYDKAIKHFKKALDNLLYKTPWITYTNLGRVYMLKGDKKLAIKNLNLSLSKNSRQCIPYELLGEIYKNDKNYDEAINSYEGALKYCKDKGEAHFNLLSFICKVKTIKTPNKNLKSV